ncbi:MAG TPA: diacylglycerol kinase family protein [Candidatus Angelobacter sp.]|nr:diacylglycerol kinase family protein [Candidatus Angelobacter sp.]
MNRRILLIANPGAAAGRATGRWENLLGGLRRRNLRFDYVITERPRQGVILAQEASGKYDVIAAVGGDGTMNEVANGLLLAGDTKAALAVIPFGTGNDLARMIGIRSVEVALDALARGASRQIDAIEVSCHEHGKPTKHFALLYAAAGFAGEVGKHTTPTVKAIFGTRFCYSVGFFRALLSFESPTMRVRCGEQAFEGRMFLVSAAKAEVIGGGTMRLSPGAKMDDGKLTVNIVGNLGRLETLRCFPRLLKGTHTTHPKVNCLTASSLTVESEPAVELQLDGELIGYTPATFEVKPKAIRVVTTHISK